MAKKNLKKICKHCGFVQNKHEDWIATGEYSPKSICPNTPYDKDGRYRKLIFFEPIDNLLYLEKKALESERRKEK